MGKVYQFPNQNKKASKPLPVHTEEQMILKNVVNVLTESYTTRIEELSENRANLEKTDGKQLKGAKELTKFVRELGKLFYKYGISSNCYHFVTHKNLQVLYFNDRKLVYVYEENKPKDTRQFSLGEFISEFENYNFTLMLDEEVYKILEKQIEELRITIKVLNNTKV